MKCTALADCPEEGQPKKGGHCEGHAKQAQRGQPFTPLRDYGMTPRQALENASLDFADASAEDEESYERLRDNLRTAAVRYFLSLPRAKELLAAAEKNSEQRKAAP